MTPAEFKMRLEWQHRRGLTDSDLAVWFDRPRSTVASWLWRCHLPRRGAIFDELQRRLLLLEGSPDFPFPYQIRQRARRAYVIEAFKNADNRGVPSGDPTIVGSVLPDPDQGRGGTSDVPRYDQGTGSVGHFDE